MVLKRWLYFMYFPPRNTFGIKIKASLVKQISPLTQNRDRGNPFCRINSTSIFFSNVSDLGGTACVMPALKMPWHDKTKRYPIQLSFENQPLVPAPILVFLATYPVRMAKQSAISGSTILLFIKTWA